MSYQITDWSGGDVLGTAETLDEARTLAAAILTTPSPLAAEPDTVPSDAIEGWHANDREECASVLIIAV